MAADRELRYDLSAAGGPWRYEVSTFPTTIDDQLRTIINNIQALISFKPAIIYYGPTIRQYYPLVFNAAGSAGPSEWKAYDPGHASVDGYAVDYYGPADANQSNHNQIVGQHPSSLAQLGIKYYRG